MKVLQLALISLGLISPAFGAETSRAAPKQNKVTNFIAFGDSYTDNCNRWRSENILGEGAKYPYPKCPPPPTGRASGGRSWTEYLTRLGHVDTLAFSGATCNNAYFNRNLPDVGQQIDLLRTKYNTTPAVKDLTKLYDPKTTVAAIYIGTNDHAFFLTDLSEADPNVTASNSNNKNRHSNFLGIPDCVRTRLQTLHDLGLRRFVLLQNVPLQEFPLYGNSLGGKTVTESFVLANNRIQELQAQNLVAGWKDGTTIDIFPTYQLFESFFANQAAYSFTSQLYSNTSVRFDSLHPSDRANRYLASKMERFILEDARGAKLINGTA